MDKFAALTKVKTGKSDQVIDKDLVKPKKVKPSKSLQAAANELAIKQGWTSLNSHEKQLIDLLRYTSYHGRNIVMDVAMAMRRSHPWVDGSPANTMTTYPDSKFFLSAKGL